MMSGRSVRHTNGIWTADHDSLPYLAADKIDRPPIKLILSLVGRCNLRCFHCLGTSDELVRTSQDPASASPELVDFIVDHIVPEVRAIRLGGVAFTEELTSRTFTRFMERMQPHAPQLGAFEMVTNLSVMTQQRADLLARCLTEIQVSLEGIGDTFTRLRGFPWSNLVKHFRMLGEAKKRNPATRMKITLLACAMSDTLDDLLRVDVFKSLGAERIIVRELVPRAEQHLPHVLYREPEKTRAFVRELSRRAREAGIETMINIATRYDPGSPRPMDSATELPISDAPMPSRPRPELRSCAMPFEVLTVVHTGQFGVCDFITDLAGPLANLSSLNIMDVWNSPRFTALRKAVNSSSPPPVCLSCEIKVGHLSEEEKSEIRTQAKLGRTVPAELNDWSASMGNRYVDLHWISGSSGEKREAALREAVARAEQAETRAAELARVLDERDRTIDAMMKSRAWRMARRWGMLKRAVRKFLRRR
jgi:MoaA/NifB/PqqE/SkfB family radical SAM enzyme/flavin-binding protein dodecin